MANFYFWIDCGLLLFLGMEDGNSLVKPLKANRRAGNVFEVNETGEAEYIVDDIGVSNMSFEDIGPDEPNWSPI